jgi:hypothetical protein
MATIKKMRKAQNGIKATTDSTTFYTKKLKFDADKETEAIKYGYPSKQQSDAAKQSGKDLESLARQSKKGKPGYDANGFSKMKSGGKVMLKRKDGSKSPRGLWDNIRANKGSGKKPTAAMLKQEKKIKAKTK